jgi:hypothetical protein
MPTSRVNLGRSKSMLENQKEAWMTSNSRWRNRSTSFRLARPGESTRDLTRGTFTDANETESLLSSSPSPLGSAW